MLVFRRNFLVSQLDGDANTFNSNTLTDNTDEEGKLLDRQMTDRKTDRMTERQTNRQTERQRYKDEFTSVLPAGMAFE